MLPEPWATVMVWAGVIVIIVVMLRLSRVRRRKLEESRGNAAGESPEARLKATMEELSVKLLEMSRSLNAQLDTKMRALGALLTKADETAARLERLLAEKRETPACESPTRFDDIYRLADEGKGAAEIARLKNLQSGEVELILNLRRKKGGG